MTTIGQWLTQGHKDVPPSIQRQLLSHVLNKNSAWLFGHDDTLLSEQQIQQLNHHLKQYMAGKPLAYITGHQAFWDLTLKVNEHTLIPRPDTELIIETLQTMTIQPKRILDLGTGSGALALVLARLYPDSKVTATDISQAALQVAADNARRYQINNIEFIQSHWFAELNNNKYNVIVSNPPYIEPDDVHLSALTHEPITALVAEDKGLADLQIIIGQAQQHLTNDGLLMVEHGYKQQQAVFDLFSDHAYSNIKPLFDIEHRPRATLGYGA